MEPSTSSHPPTSSPDLIQPITSQPPHHTLTTALDSSIPLPGFSTDSPLPYDFVYPTINSHGWRAMSAPAYPPLPSALAIPTSSHSTQATSLSPDPSPVTRPRRKRKGQDTSDPSGFPVRHRTQWRTEVNELGKNPLKLLIDWLTTPVGKGLRIDKWWDDSGNTTRSSIGDEISRYLAHHGFPNVPGKSVEQQIREMERSFFKAREFRASKAQEVKKKAMEKVLEEKEQNGYTTESDEWKELVADVETNFQRMLTKMCPYYEQLAPVFQRRNAPTSAAVKKSTDVVDKDAISSKKHPPLETPSTTLNDHCGVSIDPALEASLSEGSCPNQLPVGPDIPVSASSVSIDNAPINSQDHAKAKARNKLRRSQATSGSTAWESANSACDPSGSQSGPSSGVLAQPLLTRVEHQQKWGDQQNRLLAEQATRRAQVESNARLADMISYPLIPHLNPNNDAIQALRLQKETLELEQIKLQEQNLKELHELKKRREMLELDKMQRELDRQRKQDQFEEINTRGRLYKEYMDNFSMSLAEAKLTVDEMLAQ